MTHAAAINVLESIPEKYMDKVIEMLESFKNEITKTATKKKKRDWRKAIGDPELLAIAGNNGKPLHIEGNDKEPYHEYLTEKYL